MNADKKMDLVCIGTATANLKVYANTSGRPTAATSPARASAATKPLHRLDARACASCHGAAGAAADGRNAGLIPMFAGIDMKDVTLTSATLGWDFGEAGEKTSRR